MTHAAATYLPPEEHPDPVLALAQDDLDTALEEVEREQARRDRLADLRERTP